VADTNNNRIQVFDTDGNYVARWENAIGAEYEFESPHGMAVDSVGNVYVTDFDLHTVQVFDSDGDLVRAWGGPGRRATSTSHGEWRSTPGAMCTCPTRTTTAPRDSIAVGRF